MNELQLLFPKADLSDWKKAVEKELKNRSADTLHFFDSLEELEIIPYAIAPEKEVKSDFPGIFPYARGWNQALNDWKTTKKIYIHDEKTANDQALSSLMHGCDSLSLVAQKEHINWTKVIEGIHLEFVKIQFTLHNPAELGSILTLIDANHYNRIAFNFDPVQLAKNDRSLINQQLRPKQFQAYQIQGFAIQNSGGNSRQELTFCLNAGHETLLELMDSGLTIDEAAACIHFSIGVGNDYLIQIAKIRLLRELWAKIIHAYAPKHACSHKCSITAIVGHMNKSLKDPHTNLLRQTTESMSAIIAGIDQLLILPYDEFAASGVTALAERMAINIGLILKEESYFDKVIDPLGGSYSLATVQESLGKQVWNAFKDLETNGGLFNEKVRTEFLQSIVNKAKERVTMYAQNEKVLIGVNKFKNPEIIPSSWQKQQPYLGMEALVLENSIG